MHEKIYLFFSLEYYEKGHFFYLVQYITLLLFKNVLSLVLYYLQRLDVTTQSFVDVVQRIYFKFPELSCQQEPGHGLELQKVPDAIQFLIQDVVGIDRGKSEKEKYSESKLDWID